MYAGYAILPRLRGPGAQPIPGPGDPAAATPTRMGGGLPPPASSACGAAAPCTRYNAAGPPHTLPLKGKIMGGVKTHVFFENVFRP